MEEEAWALAGRVLARDKGHLRLADESGTLRLVRRATTRFRVGDILAVHATQQRDASGRLQWVAERIKVLTRYRLSRYFFYPPVVVLSLTVIYTLLIGTFIIGA